MAPRSLMLGLGLGVLAATALAAPSRLQARSVIDHDAVVGFDETVPDNVEGELYLKYKPYLDVINGCVPYPAVDADGNTSGGLKPTGSSSGGCSDSTGQVYGRAMAYNSYWAIMYAWYFPKDESSQWIGHRHDWEACVVFLDSESTDAAVVGMTVSQHSGVKASTSPSYSGTSPLVGYVSYWPIDHALIFDSTVGDYQPLIAWESLPTAAQEALETTDFGSANVPFKDSNFAGKIAAAAEALGLD